MANWRDKSIDTALAKRNMILSLIIFVIYLLGALNWFSHLVGDVLINVDHQLKNLLEDVFNKIDVFLCDAGFALNQSDNELW